MKPIDLKQFLIKTNNQNEKLKNIAKNYESKIINFRECEDIVYYYDKKTAYSVYKGLINAYLYNEITDEINPIFTGANNFKFKIEKNGKGIIIAEYESSNKRCRVQLDRRDIIVEKDIFNLGRE